MSLGDTGMEKREYRIPTAGVTNLQVVSIPVEKGSPELRLLWERRSNVQEIRALEWSTGQST